MGKLTKKQKLKEKLKLLEKVVNVLIEDRERKEKEDLGPQKKVKKAPTPKQAAVQKIFGTRAKIASNLYHAEGSTLTWADAMVAAGGLIQTPNGEYTNNSDPHIPQELLNLVILPESTEPQVEQPEE